MNPTYFKDASSFSSLAVPQQFQPYGVNPRKDSFEQSNIFSPRARLESCSMMIENKQYQKKPSAFQKYRSLVSNLKEENAEEEGG